jgi:hypothetical protein
MMRVGVSMTADKNEFNVSSWWATKPEYVLSALQSQLEAAQAIWPELKEYGVLKKRSRSKSKPSNEGALAGEKT